MSNTSFRILARTGRASGERYQSLTLETLSSDDASRPCLTVQWSSGGLREKWGRCSTEGRNDSCYETSAGRCYGCWDKGWSDGCYETRAGSCCGCWDRDWSDSCYETRAGCCCGRWRKDRNGGCCRTRAGRCCRFWDKGRLRGWDSPNGPGDREDRIIQKPEFRDQRPELLE